MRESLMMRPKGAGALTARRFAVRSVCIEWGWDMQCPECGSDILLPSERRITIDRGEVFEAPVPAVECHDCGKMFAAEDARQQMLRRHSQPTLPPPDELTPTR